MVANGGRVDRALQYLYYLVLTGTYQYVISEVRSPKSQKPAMVASERGPEHRSTGTTIYRGTPTLVPGTGAIR